MRMLKGLMTGAVLLAGAALPMNAFAAGEIVIAIGSEPSTLDPQARDDGGERAVNDNIYETLMARTADATLVPGLAAQEPTKVDDTTWEFKLREGISFTNGEPFNADSVVASVTRILDPALNSEQLAYFGGITGAEKVDDLTVHIKTTGPDPILPSRMYWMKMVPAEYSKDPKFGELPVGTGPYKLEAFNRGQDIILVANADYWDGAPSIDKVTYRFVGEPGTRLSGLVAGEFDVITNLLPEFVDSVPKSATVQGLETSVIVLSTDNEVTKDPKVREAMNIAIDRQALADSLFGGYGLPARGQIVNPKAFGFNEALQPYPYDPEKAKQLIAEAGATGKTINLVGESGRWLKDRELIEAVGQYWSEAGLNVNYQIEEFGQYLTLLFDQQNRPDAVFVVNSDELLDADRPMTQGYLSGSGFSSNSDTEMAEKVVTARTETDVEKRKALYDEVTQKAYDLNYLSPLLNAQDIYGISERLEWQPRVDAKLIVKEMQVAE